MLQSIPSNISPNISGICSVVKYSSNWPIYMYARSYYPMWGEGFDDHLVYNNITIHIFLQNGSPRTACFVVRSFGWGSLRRQLHWRGMAAACGWGAALAGSEFHQLTWWHISLIDIPSACMIWLNILTEFKWSIKTSWDLYAYSRGFFLDHEIGLMWLTVTFWMEIFLWPRANMPDTGTRWWTSWGSSVQTFPMALHGSRTIIRWLVKKSSNSPWRVTSFYWKMILEARESYILF